MATDVKSLKDQVRRARRDIERFLARLPAVGRYRWEPAGLGHCVACVRDPGERYTFGNLYVGRRTVEEDGRRWLCRTDRRCLWHTFAAVEVERGRLGSASVSGR